MDNVRRFRSRTDRREFIIFVTSVPSPSNHQRQHVKKTSVLCSAHVAIMLTKFRVETQLPNSKRWMNWINTKFCLDVAKLPTIPQYSVELELESLYQWTQITIFHTVRILRWQLPINDFCAFHSIFNSSEGWMRIVYEFINRRFKARPQQTICLWTRRHIKSAFSLLSISESANMKTHRN